MTTPKTDFADYLTINSPKPGSVICAADTTRGRPCRNVVGKRRDHNGDIFRAFTKRCYAHRSDAVPTKRAITIDVIRKSLRRAPTSCASLSS
jgi:hypothetical protein